MVVLCDGMLRSGSTWSFNVVRELIRTCEPHRKVFGFYSENPAVILSAARPRFSNLVIKSHKLDPSAYELCSAGAIKAVYTWRDPHDVIVSSQRMFGDSVDHSIGLLRNALRVWSFHRATSSACIISYESMIHSPLTSIHSIAAYLGLRVEPKQAAQIAEVTSLENLKSFSQHVDELEGSRVVRKDGLVYDRQTLVHQNHIQNGGVGYGAGLLDPEHVSAIDALLREEGFDFLCDPGSGRH